MPSLFPPPGTDWAALAQEWIRQQDNAATTDAPEAPQENIPPLPPDDQRDKAPPLPDDPNRQGEAPPPLPPPMNGRNGKG